MPQRIGPETDYLELIFPLRMNEDEPKMNSLQQNAADLCVSA